MDIDQKRRALGEGSGSEGKVRGFRKIAFAKMVGSSKSHIWRIEKGHVGVGIDDLARIADALGTQVRDLLTF